MTTKGLLPKIMAMDKEDISYSFHCAICLYHFTKMDQPSHYDHPICQLDQRTWIETGLYQQ